MIALTLALALVSGDYAPSRQGTDPLQGEQEVRVMRLGKQLRCAVCQGLSIADSPASMARAQLDKVRELVAQGKSDQEVMDYFVARYGEWALLEPTTNGLNWMLWFGPGLLLIIGAIIILAQVQRPAKGQPGAAASAAAAVAAESADPYLAQVRAELEK